MLHGSPAILAFCVMVVLWKLQDVVHNEPACGYCNRKREHARDCPLQKIDD